MKYLLTLILILNTIPVFAHDVANDPLYQNYVNRIQFNLWKAKLHGTCVDEYDDCDVSQELNEIEESIDDLEDYTFLYHNHLIGDE